jgi:hypothetical protein
MTNSWKALAIAGLLVVAGLFGVAAFAQTAASSSSPSYQRGGMMGSYTGGQGSGSYTGRGMMGGMMGGGMMGWEASSNSASNATSTWDFGDMLTWCRNAMAGFFNQTALP